MYDNCVDGHHVVFFGCITSHTDEELFNCSILFSIEYLDCVWSLLLSHALFAVGSVRGA